MNTEKKSFMFYASWFQNLEGLSEDLQIQLYKAIMRYAFFNEIPELHPMLMFGFNEIKAQIDRDNSKWEDKREKRRQAGIIGNQKRWGSNNESQTIAKVANARNESQTIAKVAVDVDVDADVDVDVDADVDVDVDADVDVTHKVCVCDNNSTPTLDMCVQYAEKKGFTRQQAEKFFYFHDGNGWHEVANWKSKLTYWCKKDEASPTYRAQVQNSDKEEEYNDTTRRLESYRRNKMLPQESKEHFSKWMKENGYTETTDEVIRLYRQYCQSQN